MNRRFLLAGTGLLVALVAGAPFFALSAEAATPPPATFEDELADACNLVGLHLEYCMVTEVASDSEGVIVEAVLTDLNNPKLNYETAFFLEKRLIRNRSELVFNSVAGIVTSVTEQATPPRRWVAPTKPPEPVALTAWVDA